MSEAGERWELNYFNYFTEIEDHFQQVRGTSLFLLSPLDWALIESWKKAEIPLEAVLRGIDAAFAKWRKRKSKRRMINSLAYCTQAVMEEAGAMAGVEQRKAPADVPPPFELEELRAHLERALKAVRNISGESYEPIAAALSALLASVEEQYGDLEELELRLTALEEKMVSIARTLRSEEDLFDARRELERQLKPYRGKMSAEQLTMLERQFLDRHLLETAGLPRLSLFYLR